MDTRNRIRRVSSSFFAAILLVSVPGNAQTHAAPKKEPVTIHVAAASDLQTVMPLLAEHFEKETGIHVAVSFGASAALATQIVNGAPMDAFFAANYTFPEKVVAANLADTPEPVMYAKGTLVLWERKDGPFKPLSIDTLVNPALKSVAIANPLTAPFGLAAQQALRNMHMIEKVQPHFVQAENVAQAAQFADTGNTQLAFISLTLAKSAHLMETGTYIVMPASAYEPIRQCAVVLRHSPHHDEAKKFLDYVLSGPIQAQLSNFGLTSKDQQ